MIKLSEVCGNVLLQLKAPISQFLPFVHEGKAVGMVRRDFICLFEPFNFVITDQFISFKEPNETAHYYNTLVEEMLLHWKNLNFPALKGWRNEKYAVKLSDNTSILVERGAIAIFGFTSYGCHINAFYKKGNTTFMWVGKRSMNKATYPGYLDQMVAGGISASTGILETVIKECMEEANVCDALAKQAKFVSTISYIEETAAGIAPGIEYIFDLIVEEDFIPFCNDGEVEEFYLWDIATILERIDEFKPNCAAVIIDFCIRHSIADPQDPKFMDLFHSIHVDIQQRLINFT